MKPYSDIIAELVEMDNILAKAWNTVEGELTPSLETDIYRNLLNSIVSQQLSVKVADVIWNRFIGLFGDGYPHAEEIVNMEDETLRGVGLSRQKLGYIKNVAQFSLENDMSFEHLDQMSDEAIIKYLTTIKGIGKWTVQMVLMFAMDRPNVFPVDDLGVQTKMKHWYGIDLEKKQLREKLNELSEQWHPYKSIGSKIMWRSIT